MTTSSEERAAKIPPLECMFKASGDQLERKLQHYIRGRGDWLTVVTGPKGSYREEHILNYLENTLTIRQKTGIGASCFWMFMLHK